MKVVLAATTLEEAQPALDWCEHHLGRGDVVTIVYGVSGLGEFALGLPPLDALGGEAGLRVQLERTYRAPLERAGIDAGLRVVAETTNRAIAEVANAVDADMIVIGKQRHRAAIDAFLGSPAVHLAHDPPCPVVIVPVADDDARQVEAGALPGSA